MDWLREHFRTTRDAQSPERALNRYRMGMRAGGSIRGVRILAGQDSCPQCRALTGIVYTLDAAPTLPNPSCNNPSGCRCVYRPVMTYETDAEGSSSGVASSIADRGFTSHA